MSQLKVGYLYAVGAYFSWGLIPLYWKLLSHVRADDILSHRIIWSLLFYFLIWFFFFRKPKSKTIWTRKLALQIAGAATLVCANWYVYIWSVNSGHVLESSLGYFINPLVNVLIGFFVLNEKLSRSKWVAVGLATTGVLIMSLQVKEIWISLFLALTFGFYGLLRKIMKAPPIQTSLFETLILSLPALFYAVSHHEIAATWSVSTYALLAAGGIVTGLPLWWFAEAATRVPLSIMGIFQFIAPTLQFLQAVLIFHEPFGLHQAISFGFIWVGLVVFATDLIRHRAPATPPPS